MSLANKARRIPTWVERRTANKPAVQKALDEGNISALLDGLTYKQRNFCQEFIKDFNASAACLRAGYTTKYPDKMGNELLRKDSIRMAVDALLEERSQEISVSVDYVLRKLVQQLEKAEDKDQAMIVLRAAELLGKHLGMFKEKTEISGPDGEAIRVKQEIQQHAADFARTISRLTTRGSEEPDLVRAIPRDTGSP